MQRRHLALGIREDFAGFFHVGAFEADDDGDFEGDFFAGFYEGFGDDVALGDAAEDVDEDAFDVGVGEDDAEGFDGAFGGDGAAYVEEVGGLCAVEFDDVHGGHGEAGAVDEAADVSVEGDVIEAGFLGADIERAFLGFIDQGGEIRMAECRVVVEIEFGVDGEKFAILGDHQRIYFREGGVHFDEGLAEIEHELGGFGGELVFEA